MNTETNGVAIPLQDLDKIFSLVLCLLNVPSAAIGRYFNEIIFCANVRFGTKKKTNGTFPKYLNSGVELRRYYLHNDV